MRGNLILFALAGTLLFAAKSQAQSANVTLAWNPSTGGDVAGYDIDYGTSSGNYTVGVPVGNVTNATIKGLTPGVTYYFVATAYDSSGDVSGYSPEISYTVGSSGAATLTPTARLQGGQFQFSVSGTTASQYVVQASTDLVNWVSIATNTSSSSFVDPTASQFKQRFYRIAYASN